MPSRSEEIETVQVRSAVGGVVSVREGSIGPDQDEDLSRDSNVLRLLDTDGPVEADNGPV